MRAALALVILAAFVAIPATGHPAERTDVADGPADDAPMDLSLDLRFLRSSKSARILKEYHSGLDTSGAGGANPRIIDSNELRYEESRSTLEITARAGLGRNVELSAGVPLVLSRQVRWRLPSGKSAARSLIFTNEYGAGGCPGRSTEFGGWAIETNGRTAPNDPTRFEAWECVPNTEAIAAGAVNRPFVPFDVQGEAHFSGPGDPWLGFTVGVLEDDPEGGDPAWIVGLRYDIPLSPIADPAAANTEGDPGGVGSGFHRFTVRTALSKRLGTADPYAELAYTLSIASGKAFSNCDHPENLGTPENCSRWSGDASAQPRHVAGLVIGTELTPWSEAQADRRFWLDANVGAQYHSEGRDYSEASWMLRRLTYTDDFARLSGNLRVAFDGSRHFRVGLEGGLSWDSTHILTRETIGKDLDHNGQVDLDNVGGEINPNFDFRFDTPGRRLIVDSVFDYSLGVFARLAL